MKVKRKLLLLFIIVLCFSAAIIGCGEKKSEKKTAEKKEAALPALTFLGHASVKIKSKSGKVIYIDPAEEDGDYSEAADYILVTHEHEDHNRVDLCKTKDKAVTIRSTDALVDGKYKTFDYGDVKIETVPSGGNPNHSVDCCVGYIVTVDGIKVFHAGDTSMNDKTKEICGKNIDYAMYPIDGKYNMDAAEAAKVADLIAAKNNIPFHSSEIGEKEDTEKIKAFNPKGKLVLEKGKSISLKK